MGTVSQSRPSIRAGRYRELKYGAAGHVRARPQSATVRFDDRTADGQAQAHALGLGGVERLEQAVQTLRIHSRTAIPQTDEYAVRSISARADQQLPRPLADAAHRLDGVDDQVENHLLQLDPICSNDWQALRELRPHRDAALQNFGTGQGYDLKHRLVDLQVLLPRRRLLDKGPDTADDVAGSHAVPDDTTERLPDLFQIWRLSTEPVQPGLCVGDNRRDRLSDFMGNRGHELPHRRDAARVRQLRLHFAVAALAVSCFGFRPLALGDVVEKDSDASAPGVFDPEGVNVIPASELFGFIFKAHRLARQGDPAINLEPMFFVPWRDFAHSSAGGILDSRLPFKRRADLQKTIIDRLFVLIKQNFNRAKTLVNRFEQHAVILFRLAQFRLGAIALDELTDLVADGSQHVEQLLIGLPDLATEKLDHAQDFPAEQDGKPKAACSPSRWAMGPRGKLSSGTTSGMYSGSRLDHTRPGSPKPGTKVNSRLTLSNSGTSIDALCQSSTQRSASASRSTRQSAPTSHPRPSPIARSILGATSSIAAASAKICPTVCCTRRRSSVRFRSSMSVNVPYHLRILPCSSRSGTARTKNQRYSPLALRCRASFSNGSPLARVCCHLIMCPSRSSG